MVVMKNLFGSKHTGYFYGRHKGPFGTIAMKDHLGW